LSFCFVVFRLVSFGLCLVLPYLVFAPTDRTLPLGRGAWVSSTCVCFERIQALHAVEVTAVSDGEVLRLNHADTHGALVLLLECGRHLCQCGLDMRGDRGLSGRGHECTVVGVGCVVVLLDGLVVLGPSEPYTGVSVSKFLL